MSSLPKPWSVAEVQKLRKFAKARMTSREAARRLKRSPGATRYKAMMEQISFRSGNR